MRIIIKTFILFLFTLSFFIPLRLSYAQSNYVVKPIILIPNDWRNRIPPEEMDQYKKGVLDHLSSAQDFFAGKLEKKTFNFEQSVDVVYSSKNIEGNDEKTIAEMFNFLNKGTILVFDRPLINSESGKVKVIWIVGSKVFGGIYAYATSVSPVSGMAFMPYEDLLRATEIPRYTERQLKSIAILTHELGHTFGLVLSGYAKGHPCSELSPNECIEGAPQPYPPAYEWTSIMGYGFQSYKFPEIHLNNTLFNPEVKKIYQSPFINPQNDPAPEPAPGLGAPIINYFSLGLGGLTVTAGTVITINNIDKMFGENPGKVEFLSPPELTLALGEDNYELQVWDSKKIQILIKESAESSTTKRRWKLKLTTPEGKVFQSEDNITIQGKDFGKSAFLVLTALLLTTCGQEKRPVSASLNFTGPSASKTVGTSVKTDSLTGRGEVSLGIENPKAGNQYHLTPIPFPEVPETPEEKIITLETSDVEARKKAKVVSFTTFDTAIHYPTCPTSIFTPPSNCGTLKFQYNQCIACNTSQPVYKDDCGNWTTGQNQPDKSTDCAKWCSSPAPYISQCTEIDSYNECISCNTSRRVSKDSCGNYKVIVESQYDSACSSWCTDSAPPPTPAPTGTGAESPGKILISNYSDFRDSNAPRDMGSPTITINNPNGQTVIWTLNTLDSSKKPIYVRTISGEDYNDYKPVEMGEGDTVEIAGIKIQAKMVKKIVKMTVIINGENRFVDLNNPQDITVRLLGTEGQTQTLSIPYIIEYSNGEVTRSALEINYQPDSFTSPTPRSIFQCIGEDSTEYNPGDYEKKCTGNCIRNGCYPGNYTGGEQAFRQCGANGVWSSWQSQCNNTDCGQFCNNIPTSPPQCTEIDSYNECISCNTSRRVSKDSCGNYKIIVESQYDSACSSWCTVPEPTGCPAQPPTRGKTWVPIREGAGYFCGYGGADVCNAQGHFDTCVGVPWECRNGQWIELNPYGECTTVCTDCK